METMLFLIGKVASSMPRMSLTIFVFSHYYRSHVTLGLVYEVSLPETEEGQRHRWNSGVG